ncbi:MAG: hypothetical protein ABEJ72_02865 [Candidatus Aenigmatarchaeota archaeon]
MDREQVIQHYRHNQGMIGSRLEEFQDLENADDYRLFMELVFVILTSQSSARNSWEAVKELDEKDLLLKGDSPAISRVLSTHDIQYENKKADYIVKNREYLSQPTLTTPTNELRIKEKLDSDPEKSRKWMVENLEGVSWKAASHFLRNTGNGDLAIISGHILKKLKMLGVIDSIERPSNYDEYRYLEHDMEEFANQIGISLSALDLTLWSMETGEVFK